MDIFDRFKRFLGFSESQRSPEYHNPDSRSWPHQPPEDEGLPSYHNGPGRNFNIFSDPLEIHKYFEQQMDEMLRNFGFGEFSDGFTSHFDFPQIEEPPGNDIPQSRDLRDQFLKPGFDKPAERGSKGKEDQDLDGKLDIRDWGSVFKGENSVTPFQKGFFPRTHFFGQSVTSKTVRNPDGSVEIHHTVRDNQGNEETTITRKMGDKEYSIIKRRDKEGKEETIENLVNLDEKELDKFFPKHNKIPELDQKPWPFFDKFFK